MTMAIEQAISELDRRMRRLATSVTEVRVALVEDRPVKPRGADVALFDQFELAVDDVQGWIEEAFSGVRCVRQALEASNVDWAAARRILAGSQQRLQRTQWHFALELESQERADELVRLGDERRGEWPSWVRGVRDALRSCRTPLLETSDAMSQVWIQMAEAGPRTSISVQAHSVGQEIRVGPLGENHGNQG